MEQNQPQQQAPAENAPAENAPAPVAVDLRNHILSNIGDQGKFKACWAFACACAIEIDYNRKHEYKISLSAQDFINNVPGVSDDGSANLKKVRKWLLSTHKVSGNGIVTEYVKYLGRKDKNDDRAKKNKVNVEDFQVDESANEEKIRELLDAGTPVVAVLDCTLEFKDVKGYKTFEYEARREGAEEPHAIVIVGYRLNEKQEFCFLVRNSHGKNWGKEGYGLIAAGRNTFKSIAYPRSK